MPTKCLRSSRDFADADGNSSSKPTYVLICALHAKRSSLLPQRTSPADFATVVLGVQGLGSAMKKSLPVALVRAASGQPTRPPLSDGAVHGARSPKNTELLNSLTHDFAGAAIRETHSTCVERRWPRTMATAVGA